jgi:ectoine hydroxylase-related dioxygenase (phytanoyl-CoA dioxygenase family)
MAHRALASAWRVAEACSSPRRYPGSRRSPSLARARLPARCRSATAETLLPSRWVEENADAASLREHYEREGWVVVRGVADAALVDALHAATDALEEEAKTFTRSRRHRGVFFETQSASGRKSDDAIRAGALRKIGSPSKRGGAFAALVRSERIRDIALTVCLSETKSTLRCAVDQVNTKAPFSEGSGFAWHQDASFLKPLARCEFDAHGGVNVVVAMDESDSQNGGFEVLGRTHCDGEAPKSLRDAYDGAVESVSALQNVAGTKKKPLFDESFRVCPALLPGDAVFFHPMLAHGSGRNASARRRRIATLWYVAHREG